MKNGFMKSGFKGMRPSCTGLTFSIALFLSLLIQTGTPSQAQAVEWGEWQEVKTLYDAGKLDDAIASLRSKANSTSAFHYNLGTLLLASQKTGEALAHLEKANRLKPHDPEIQTNLKIARDSLGGVIGVDQLDPASSSLEAIADQLPRDEANGIIGLLALIVGGLWARAYNKNRSLTRVLSRSTGTMGLIGLILIASLYALLQVSRSQPPAALLERQTIRSGPGETFPQMIQLEAGVKVRVTGAEDQGWTQIRHSKDRLGWIRSSSLLLL